MMLDLILTILTKLEWALLLLLGIGGVYLATVRRSAFPRASRSVGLAGWLLLARTAGMSVFGLATQNQFHAECVAVGGILVAVVIVILFTAAFEVPDAPQS